MFNNNPKGFEEALKSFWKNGNNAVANVCRRAQPMANIKQGSRQKIAEANRASLSCTKEKAMLISNQYYLMLLIAGSKVLDAARKEARMNK